MREETRGRESEIVWVKVTMKGCKNLYIAGCYRAKADDSAFLDALSTSLYRITSNSNNSVLLGGDFNFPGWDWMAGCIKPKSQYPSLHQKFGDIINDNGLAQIVQEPTRQGNVLDPGLEVRRYGPVWHTGTSLVGLKAYRHFFLARCHTGMP